MTFASAPAQSTIWAERSMMTWQALRRRTAGHPMTDEIDNLLLEHMKRFQAGQERIERKLEELVSRIGHLEGSIAGLRSDFAHSEVNGAALSVRLDRLSERFDRIEKRLELVG